MYAEDWSQVLFWICFWFFISTARLYGRVFPRQERTGRFKNRYIVDHNFHAQDELQSSHRYRGQTGKAHLSTPRPVKAPIKALQVWSGDAVPKGCLIWKPLLSRSITDTLCPARRMCSTAPRLATAALPAGDGPPWGLGGASAGSQGRPHPRAPSAEPRGPGAL